MFPEVYVKIKTCDKLEAWIHENDDITFKRFNHVKTL